MLTKMNYTLSNDVPPHSHPNEQTGYVISGKIWLKSADDNEILCAGDSYTIPANTEHSVEVLEEAKVVDFFTPPRQDYLD